MKIVRPWLYVLGAVVLVLAALLVASIGASQAASSRFAALAPAGAGGPPGSSVSIGASQGPIVVSPVKSDLSAPLASIAPIAPAKGVADVDMNQILPLPNRDRAGDAARTDGFRDPVLQEGPVGNLMPGTIANFDGVSNVNGVLPPDTNGDVGPNHYMQWVNLSFAIYSKSGTLLYGPAAGNTLWSGFGGTCSTSNNGDPIVQYDHLADRWMVSQFALPGGASGYHQCIAVSQTGDPTGAWYRYDYLWSTTKLNDYPHFGVWPDGYYMSVNQFSGTSWGGQGVAVFERSAMLTGSPTARMVKFDLFGTDPNLGGMLPSDWDGATQPPGGAPNVFAEIDDDAWGYSPDQVQMWEFHVDWTNTANSTFTFKQALGTAAFDTAFSCGTDGRTCIPQPTTTERLDVISDRLMYRMQYRNFGTHQTIMASHTVDVDGTDRAGSRWYEFRNTGGTWSIYQQGTFSPDSTDRWMGSAAMDQYGNVALGYSISSSSIYPSIRYTGRLPGDALGTLPQGEATMMSGTGYQSHSASRWGDYAMMAVDPTDDCTFWFTTEYIQTSGSANWRTRIGSFQMTGCGGPAPTPTPTSTPGPTPTPTNTPTPTPTAPPPTDTGWRSPTTNAAVTSSAGDNNGYQTNPTNAHADDGLFAVDTNSGTTTSTSCTSIRKDKHHFYNYGFSLPGTAVVQGIEVRLDARADSTSGSPKICVQLSWDGGATWTTAKQTSTLTTSEATYVLGGAADAWGHTWTLSQMSDASFRVRVIDVASSTSRDFSLDWVAVKVTYQP